MSEGTWLYCLHEIGCEAGGPSKIGVATNLGKRLASLQGGNHRKLIVAWRILMRDRYAALQTESHTLSRLRPDIYAVSAPERLSSEWVDSNPDRVLEVALSIAETFGPVHFMRGLK